MANMLPFKDQSIRGAKFLGTVRLDKNGKSKGGQTEYRIEGNPGLVLIVQAPDKSGVSTKSWRYVYSTSVDGKQKKPKKLLGKYPALSLAGAARMAGDLREAVDLGRDPVAEEKQAKVEAAQDALTFADLLADYVADRKARGATSIGELERALKLDAIPVIGAMRPKDIKDTDIQATCDAVCVRMAKELVERKRRLKQPVTKEDETRRDFAMARHVRRYLGQVFNFALLDDVVMRDKYALASNPAAVVGRSRRGMPGRYGQEQVRTRHLDDDGVAELVIALEESQISEEIKGMILLALYTCVRSDEARCAMIEEMKLDAAEPTWTIPKERTKTDTSRAIPLVPAAAEIVRKAIGKRKVGPVFAGQGRDGLANRKGMRRAIARLIASGRMKTCHISPHDLRTTIETGLTRLGVNSEVREQVLGHKGQSVAARHYNAHDYLAEKRDALIRWEEHVSKLTEAKKRADAESYPQESAASSADPEARKA